MINVSSGTIETLQQPCQNLLKVINAAHVLNYQILPACHWLQGETLVEAVYMLRLSILILKLMCSPQKLLSSSAVQLRLLKTEETAKNTKCSLTHFCLLFWWASLSSSVFAELLNGEVDRDVQLPYATLRDTSPLTACWVLLFSLWYLPLLGHTDAHHVRTFH